MSGVGEADGVPRLSHVARQQYLGASVQRELETIEASGTLRVDVLGHRWLDRAAGVIDHVWFVLGEVHVEQRHLFFRVGCDLKSDQKEAGILARREGRGGSRSPAPGWPSRLPAD